MRTQAPVRPLRGRDPLTIEIEVQALAAKPLGQLAPQNVADLVALEAMPELSHGLKVRLRGFAERMARTIADLPNGKPFFDELEAVAELPDATVPEPLRAAWAAQVELPKRGEPERTAVRELLARWADTEPEAFVIGAARRPAQVIPAREPSDGAARAPRAPAAPRAPVHRPVPTVDAARVAWIASTLLDRVQTSEGLLEEVLLTTLKHRARGRYPDLAAHEIRAVLRDLEGKGRLRSSAGRWKAR